MSIDKVHRVSIETLITLYAKRHIQASARRVVRGARYLSYDIRLKNPFQMNEAIAVSEPLALSLGVKSVAAYREGGIIRYDITLPDDFWQVVRYADMKEPFQIGVSPGNTPITFSPLDPNQMIVGVPGSGKSEGIKTILSATTRQLNPDAFRFCLIDPHRSIVEFDQSPHLALPVAHEKEGVQEVMNFFASHLKRRKQAGEATVKADAKQYPILMMVIDEASEPTVLGAERFPNKENISTIQQLAKEGRKFNLRILLGTQKPTEADLPGIFSVFPTRYVGAVTDARMAAHFSGKKEVPAHLLTGNGDFFRSRGDELTRFQFALLSPEDKQALPTATMRLPLTTEDTQTGRPILEIDPETIAYYLQPDAKITLTKAKNELGLSRTGHERHRDFALRLKNKLRELHERKQ